MDDVNMMMQLIGSLGFPIVACGALFWTLSNEQKSHKEEMAAVTQALNQNTLVMTELKDMIAALKKEVSI